MEREFEIVSHTRLKHVTAFLVQLEQRVTHIHRELELGYIMEGSLSLHTGERTVTLSPGDLYLVNRMEPHEFTALGAPVLLIAIQISPKLMEGFLPAGTHYHYEGSGNVRQDMADASETYETICAVCIELAYRFLRMEQPDFFRCFTLCASLVQMLQEHLIWQKMTEEDYAAMKQRANRILEITEYIDRNFQRKLLLGEIAEQQNLSMVYLSHFFKDTMGMSFQDYLARKRLEYACELLFHTNRKILDISLSSGYSDVRYFSEAFSAAYGCTPKEYRKGTVLQAARLQELHQTTQSFFTEADALKLIAPLRTRTRAVFQKRNLDTLF